MEFKNIKYVSNIKYKGYHRQKAVDQTIKKVNNAIDKFNNSNYDISSEIYAYASTKMKELVNQKIPEYYGMTLKAQNEILIGKDSKGGILKIITDNEEKRTDYFQRIINTWTNNSNISLLEIEKNISSVMSQLDSVTKSEILALKKSCDKFITEKIIDLENGIDKIVSKKLSQLENKCSEWIAQSNNSIERMKISIEKMEKLKNSINNLKEITNHGRGKLKKEDITIIENLIKSNSSYAGRGWVKSEIKKKAIYKSDDATNRLLLSLMAIFTDTASDRQDFIGSYFSNITKNLIK